jgi:hypothetical protein
MVKIEWTGPVACMGQLRGVYTVVVGRPEGRRLFGRPGRR